MISEVDIRDWHKVDAQRAKALLDEMKGDIYPHSFMVISDMLDHIEKIKARQMASFYHNVPAILRKHP